MFRANLIKKGNQNFINFHVYKDALLMNRTELPTQFELDSCFVFSIVCKFYKIWLRKPEVREQKEKISNSHFYKGTLLMKSKSDATKFELDLCFVIISIVYKSKSI